MSPYPTVVIVTTAHQNASGMDLKKLFSLPASAKYTADENSTTPLRTSTHQRRIQCNIQWQGALRAGRGREQIARRGLPHVSIADGGHRYNCPPKRFGDWNEIGVRTVFVRKVNSTREYDHACEHKILCARVPWEWPAPRQYLRLRAASLRAALDFLASLYLWSTSLL